ncbi:hypothetical protein ACWDNY_31305, partial [Streptomyces sp. NPDC003697]
MSTPPDVNGVAPAGDAPQGPPNVYLPQPAAAPSYEGYADPAAAHGWEDAYEGTSGPAAAADGLPEARAGRLGGHAPGAGGVADAPGSGTGYMPGSFR